MSLITNIIGTKYQSLFDPKILKNFRIDGILYKSIYHYIYSNLVHFELDKKSLINANIRDVYSEYLEIETNSRNQIIHEACEKAIESRFSTGESSDLLLGTGDSILLYKSDNGELGTGSDMLGKNLYGKMLMNFRNKLRLKREVETIEKEKEKTETKLYKTYGVYLSLLNRMTNDLDDLKQFIGLTIDEIIDVIGKQKIFDATPSPDIIYSLYTKQEIQDKDIMDNSKYLVQLIRKKYLHKINDSIKKIKENSIVESFVDWLIEYKSVEYDINLDRAAIKFEQMNNISQSQRERIIRLYSEGKLNENISEQVKERMSIFRSPLTQEELISAQSFEIPVTSGQPEEKEKIEEKERDKRPETKIQDSITYNDYFSKLFVKLLRKKTKREEHREEEEIREKIREEEQKQIEEELEKQIIREELMSNVPTGKQKVKRKGVAINPAPELTQAIPVTTQATYRPPSTIRFSEDPTKGYFGALSPLAVDKTVFYVDDYAYPSIYHYIMVRLFEMLPTVHSMSKAHGYIMSKADATNVKTYKSFEVLDREYDELYNIETLLKISSLLSVCLPIVLPPIEKIQESLQGDILHEYVYNNKEDSLLGKGETNNGFNIYGIELTKFIQSRVRTKPIVKISEEYKNTFIKKRLEDVCKTISAVINVTDSSKKLSEKDILLIIDILYAPCYELFKKEYEIDVPEIYKDLIKTYLSDKNITDNGVELIYAFVYKMFTMLEETFEGDDVDTYVKTLRNRVLNTKSFSCVGPYKNKNENCVFAAVFRIIEKMNMIHGKKMTSDKLDYIFMLITDKTEKIDYVDVDDETVPLLRSLLTPLGDSIANDSRTINGFVKEVSKNITNDILIRVVFFGI